MIANSYLHNILLCVSWKLERETEERQRRGNSPCSKITFRLLYMVALYSLYVYVYYILESGLWAFPFLATQIMSRGEWLAGEIFRFRINQVIFKW